MNLLRRGKDLLRVLIFSEFSLYPCKNTCRDFQDILEAREWKEKHIPPSYQANHDRK